MSNLLIATKNRDKTAEIIRLVDGLGINVHDLTEFPDYPDVDEGGSSLEENALIKARAANEFTGLPSIADDTGLFVDALGGEPGVLSSRFAGKGASYEDNWKLLLERMRGVPHEMRGARFICIVALVASRIEEKLFRGEVRGIILEEPKGRGGFGYDPVFYHPPSGKTFAELSLDEKNAVSHRYIAVRKAVSYLSSVESDTY
ncbi:MAG: RdgB/HAM1 family non-canonical purine NTP pyrophosphatase [Candidatus Glassbacteria bacterium]